MRNIFILLALSLFTMGVGQANEQRLISVVGNAEKSFEPDMATVHLVIWGKGESAKKAQEAQRKYYETFSKSLGKFKISPKDVLTNNYSLDPEYQYDEAAKRNKIVGYTVNLSLAVKITQLTENLGVFVDSLSDSKKVSDGGINLNSLSFDISTRGQEESALLAEAVKDAQKKAEIVAKAAGVKIKHVHRLMPGQASSPRPMLRRENLKMMSADASSEIPSGSVKVASEITVEYVIN